VALCKILNFARMDSLPRNEPKRAKMSHMPLVSTVQTDGLSRCTGILVDGEGHMFFANDDHKVLQRNPCFNNTAFIISGSQDGIAGYVDGDHTVARFNGPSALVRDKTGDLIVVDTYNHCLRRISRKDATVSTFVGNGENGCVDGHGTAARFNSPRDIVVTKEGDFVVSDGGNNCLRMVTANGDVRTLCGKEDYGCENGEGVQASFHWPTGLAMDMHGNVIVADTMNNLLRHVTLPLGVVTTFAGTGTAGFKDGPRSHSNFFYPRDVAIDGNGVVIVADSKNQRIRKIEGDVVTTVVGTGEKGSLDGPSSTATFDTPNIVKINHKGQLVVAEYPKYDSWRIVDADFKPPACVTLERPAAEAANVAMQDYGKLLNDETYAGACVCVCVCACACVCVCVCVSERRCIHRS
jgi:sugar lactone lactonase YvrE